MPSIFDAGGWSSQLSPKLSATLHGWLTEQGSLTQRVQSVCTPAASFNLRVLRHDLALPHRNEVALLASHGRVRTREILLCRGKTPLIFAHSIVARGDLYKAWASMDGIGGRSLGSVLFVDPAVQRGTLHYRRCDARHPLYQKALRWCGHIERPDFFWARRAVFVRDNRPLVVTEVFLPALFLL